MEPAQWTGAKVEGEMGKTVLVVDDSSTMRQMVAYTLTSAGYQVVEAGNGKEAVGKLNGGAKPALVVTDLNMPEMDGITLIQEIRKMPAFKFTPILMLTTESADDKKKRAKRQVQPDGSSSRSTRSKC